MNGKVCVCVCVCVCVRERESMCVREESVCVCVIEERERERVIIQHDGKTRADHKEIMRQSARCFNSTLNR